MNHPPASGRRDFGTTRWSLVLAAGKDEADSSRAREALEKLCMAYWYPLYAFVRYRGYAPDEAEDLTQAFFLRILETQGLSTVDPERGRFRSYLLGAMKHFLANEWHRARALKRGGGVAFLPWDSLAPEARYALEPAETADPGAGFDQKWAQETMARALDRLRSESDARGRGERFENLVGSLTGDESDRSEVAARLGLSKGAVKVAVHRLRKRYRELLRAEIAETVSDPADIDLEMSYLLAALRRK